MLNQIKTRLLSYYKKQTTQPSLKLNKTFNSNINKDKNTLKQQLNTILLIKINKEKLIMSYATLH
ncbi:hypothetical protein C0W80_06620 [Photobacterium leiognathi subsp. mandapamensis]|nr:hypothetical protein C0W80_06620 [Photobacterium leiognathi subsp. mandapamensis]